MKVTHSNIKDFLYTPNKYFVIPDFQRPYSWDKQNIDSFLLDLESLLDRNNVHFFGSVVYIIENNDSVIIDGQQRSTTVLLMLTALYHIALDNPIKCAIPAEQIKKEYLYNEFAARVGEEENRIKLRTVTTDNEIFENIFDRVDLNTKYKESRLYNAYSIFYNYFLARNNLEKYIGVLDRFEIVTIALDSGDDNPQEVFESINSTGKPLSDGDKIRNFALMLNDNVARQLVLDRYWKVIEQSLTEVDKDYITDFFRMYLVSRLQRDIKIEHVYPEFKRQFKIDVMSQSDVQSISHFYNTVIRQLDHYLFLKFNKDLKDKYSALKDLGFRLNYLKIEIAHPFLMRVLDRYFTNEISEAETIDIFEIIESFLARRIICNFSTTGLNKFFSILDKEILSYVSESSNAKYIDVFIYVLTERTGSTRFPTDAEVKTAISTNPFYNQRSWYNIFILSSIDDKMQTKESALLKQIASDDVELSIEHIMPQTLNKDWREMLGNEYEQIHTTYLHTLANLTLTGYNSKYSNHSFKVKKTVENGFDQSPLLINSFIKNTKTWDQRTLEKRAKWWLEMIKNIWPMPTTTYQVPNTDKEYLFQDDEDLTGTIVTSVTIAGESTKVASWADAFEVIVERLINDNAELLGLIRDDDFLNKIIHSSMDNMAQPRKINDTNTYLETGINTNRKKKVVMKILEYLDLEDEDVKVTIAQ